MCSIVCIVICEVISTVNIFFQLFPGKSTIDL